VEEGGEKGGVWMPKIRLMGRAGGRAGGREGGREGGRGGKVERKREIGER
jgi:hypothetical protein